MLMMNPLLMGVGLRLHRLTTYRTTALVRGRVSAFTTKTCTPSNLPTVHHTKAYSPSTKTNITTDPPATEAKKPQVDPLPLSQIPGPTGFHKWPIIGTVLNFRPFTPYTAKTLHLLLNSLAEKYGPIFCIQLKVPAVFISSVKDVECVLQNEGKYPHRYGMDIELIYARRNGLKNSLLEAQGEDWYKPRRVLNKYLMKPNSAQHYLSVQNEVTDDFVDILSSKELSPSQQKDLFFHYTAESIGVVCFNKRLNFMRETTKDPENVEFIEAAQTYAECLVKANRGESIAHRYYRNKTYRDLEKAKLIMRTTTQKHIQAAKEVMVAQKREGTFDPEESNLLHSLLSNEELDADDVLNISTSLYNGGTDSTAKNLQTLFYNLARYPDKQDKLREEVLSVLGPDGPLTAEAMSKLPYLKACVRESLRLIPPTLATMPRILPNDVVLSGYKVPAGTWVVVFNLKMCRDYYQQADEYIPERWIRGSDGRRPEDIPRTAYMPFSLGPRNCIGQRFAEQEIYLAAAKVVQKLKIDVAPASLDMTFSYPAFVTADEPIKFVFSKYMSL